MLNHTEHAGLKTAKKTKSAIFGAVIVLIAAASLSACGGDKEKKSGQALVSVNGEEITALQLNEEMQRSGVQPAQQEVARKQLLDALVDRQLLLNEAAKDKTDRDPKVMQAIERAKSLIIAQAYMQKRVGSIAKPTQAEVEDYFNKHPEFFTHRKQFDMRQLIIATKDLDDPLKKAMDEAKSLDEVADWLQSHNVKFARNQVSRTTADLAPELGAKLQSMPKGQLFIIREGERSMLISIADIKDAPVTLDVASRQIEQYLMNTRTKEAAANELKRLRSTAKIEYLSEKDKALAAAPASTPAPAAAPAAAHDGQADANARGVAGLK
jgi:EpsD family peptidyl-prolyl cis-trans isomerase